jgi:hypothetical protein
LRQNIYDWTLEFQIQEEIGIKDESDESGIDRLLKLTAAYYPPSISIKFCWHYGKRMFSRF